MKILLNLNKFQRNYQYFTSNLRFLRKCPIFHFLFDDCRKDREEKCSDQNFYVAGDNKDCVPVIGNIGLTNLWKSHLCKFHSVTLDTAEAILKEYPNSSKLIRVSVPVSNAHFCYYSNEIPNVFH